jgi:hypothetical protein
MRLTEGTCVVVGASTDLRMWCAVCGLRQEADRTVTAVFCWGWPSVLLHHRMVWEVVKENFPAASGMRNSPSAYMLPDPTPAVPNVLRKPIVRKHSSLFVPRISCVSKLPSLIQHLMCALEGAHLAGAEACHQGTRASFLQGWPSVLLHRRVVWEVVKENFPAANGMRNSPSAHSYSVIFHM